MEAADRALLLNFAEARRLGPRPGAVVQGWEERLAAQPSYLSRWLATASATDPEAVHGFLTGLGWCPGPRPSPLRDPGGVRQAAALQRLRDAAGLFRQPELSADEAQQFELRFATLDEASEGLLWRRTSEATFLALCALLGLSRRAAPASESPLGS